MINFKKQVVVVANKHLKEDARYFIQLLSQRNDIAVVLYTLEQYEQNEFQESANNYYIFYEINNVSKTFIDLIDIKYNNLGINIGFSNTKALIYTEHIKVSKDNLISLSQEYEKLEKNKRLLDKSYYEKIGLDPLPWYTNFPHYLNPFIYINTYRYVKKRKKLIKKYQKLISFHYFIDYFLDEYLGLKDNG